MPRSLEGKAARFRQTVFEHGGVTGATRELLVKIVERNTNLSLSQEQIKRGVAVFQSVVSEWDEQNPQDHSPCLFVQVSPLLQKCGIRIPSRFAAFRVFLDKRDLLT